MNTKLQWLEAPLPIPDSGHSVAWIAVTPRGLYLVREWDADHRTHCHAEYIGDGCMSEGRLLILDCRGTSRYAMLACEEHWAEFTAEH